MRISSSLTLNAQNQLSKTSRAIARSLERLSTGQRVNSPADDSAAFSTNTRLESQTRDLTQAAMNINLTQGLLQTADSAIASQLDLVQRMRELAVEASNGTLNASDRTNLNREMQQLLDEYNRITASTNFNGLALLDGSLGTKSIQLGPDKVNAIDFSIESGLSNEIFTKIAGTGSYSTSQTMTAGGTFFNDQNGQAVADLNGDGAIDAVTTNWGNSTISVFLNDGTGRMRAPVDYGAAFQSGQVALGDVDGDGIIDIVTNNYSETSISIYKGKGDGTFNARTTIAANLNNYKITLGDLNEDGRLDIVQSDFNLATISVYFNNGSGTFAAAKTLLTGNGPTELKIMDVNNDGHLDMVNANLSQLFVSTFLGDGKGNFGSRIDSNVTAGNANNLALGDINNDGKVDLAVDTGYNAIRVYLGNGLGGFDTNSQNITGLSTPSSVQFRDMNNDGNLDLIYTETAASYQVVTHLGNGTGTFAAAKSNGYADRGFEIADFNEDGVLDLFSVSYDRNGAILTQNSQTVSGLKDMTLNSQSKAQASLKILDNAIANLTDKRANISALYERLDTAASVNLLASESMSDALSRSRDVDVAEETAELVRNQILQQAQIAVLTQANSQLQVVLGLLQNF